MQRDLLNRTSWDAKGQLGSTMFESIEGCNIAGCRFTSLDNLSPADFEQIHTAAEIKA